MRTRKASFRHRVALTCFAAAVWLAAACGACGYEESPPAKEETETPTSVVMDEEDSSGERLAAADMQETPTSVAVDEKDSTGEQATAAAVQETPSGAAMEEKDPCEAYLAALANTIGVGKREHDRHMGRVSGAVTVRHKYDSLFWRQPNVYDVSTGLLRDGKGGWTDTWGIIVWVTAKVDQETLPVEDRIPDRLEGIPVQIVDEEPPVAMAAEAACEEYTCGTSSSAKEGSMTETTEIYNTPERIHEVRVKYDLLFWRQPNVFAVGEGFFKDENGEWTEKVGISITVTKKVDQSTLPPGDRIPACLEGVPVNIEEEEYSEGQLTSLSHTEESNG